MGNGIMKKEIKTKPDLIQMIVLEVENLLNIGLTDAEIKINLKNKYQTSLNKFSFTDDDLESCIKSLHDKSSVKANLVNEIKLTPYVEKIVTSSSRQSSSNSFRKETSGRLNASPIFEKTTSPLNRQLSSNSFRKETSGRRIANSESLPDLNGPPPRSKSHNTLDAGRKNSSNQLPKSPSKKNIHGAEQKPLSQKNENVDEDPVATGL